MNLLRIALFLLTIVQIAPVFAQNHYSTSTVYFPFDSSDPDSVSLQELKSKLSSSLVDTILFEGYCDPLGTESYNDSLAKARNESVIHWLIQERIISRQSVKVAEVAKGERNPINSNSTSAERQANRRVVVRWTEPLIPLAQSTNKQIIENKKVPFQDSIIPETLEDISLDEQIDLAKTTGKSLVLENINFYGGTDEFLKEAYPTLKELLRIMESRPELNIEIQGHVCCTVDGQDGPNNRTGGFHLSVDRAKAVYFYLVKNGIKENRMKYKGFGGSKRLVYPEMTESERTKNRRVEIVVLKD